MINLGFGVAGVLKVLYDMSKGRGSVFGLMLTVLAVTLGFINAWALFIVCKRSLDADSFKNHKNH